MPWRGESYPGEFPSLGWQVAEWLEEFLVLPDGSRKPFRLTDEQLELLVRWYALDSSGRRLKRRGASMRAKGWGKSPLFGGVAIAELCGPVFFDGWDADGEPVGRPWPAPWVQIAAVSEDQTDNTYGAAYTMLDESDAADDLDLDIGLTRIHLRDRPASKIEAVTASSGAREGQRITFAVLDETHLWYPERGGLKLAATLRRNAAKMGGTTFETTNAPELGRGTVAEKTLDAVGAKGLLFDGVEAPWVDDVKDPAQKRKVLEALEVAYSDSSTKRGGWVDLERIYEEAMDPDTPESDVIRFFFNIPRKGDNKAWDPKQFAGLVKSVDTAGVPVVLMFDGARTRDCAVLSAWALTEVPHHFAVQVWERPANPDENYEHPRGEIRGAVREFIAERDVALFVYDSSFHELNSLYDEWLDEWGEANPEKGTGLMVGYPTASGQRMEKAILRVLEDTRAGLYTHDGNEQVTAHVMNAVLGRNRSGYITLQKEKDSLKIDGAVTLTMGYDVIAAARLMLDKRGVEPAIFVDWS